jgi:Leucine-rich repeat (LRR) protein
LISQLTQIQALHLSENQLSAIPDSIGQLGNLQFLYLYNNRISALPESLARLASRTGYAPYPGRKKSHHMWDFGDASNSFSRPEAFIRWF